MKKNGFTMLDVIIIIVVLGVSALIVLPKISNALNEYDNKDEVYSEILASYLKCAEVYGETKKENIKNGENTIITIDDLLKEGYIHNYQHDIIDIRDKTTKMNNIKIKLNYDEENDKVYAEIN